MNTDLPLIIIGAGGHGRVVADSAYASGKNVAGFLDPSKPKGARINGIAVLGDGTINDPYSNFPDHSFFIGLGDGPARWQQFNALKIAKLPVPHIIHPFSYISPSATIGSGALVAAGVVVQANAKIGEAVILNTGSRIDHDCKIGNGAMIAPGSTLCGNVEIGAHAFIGAGAVITPGVTIGDNAFIGAGSVVVENIPINSVYKPHRKAL